MLTFMQVVALAFDPVPSGPDWVFTVTYRKAAGKPHEGAFNGRRDRYREERHDLECHCN